MKAEEARDRSKSEKSKQENLNEIIRSISFQSRKGFLKIEIPKSIIIEETIEVLKEWGYVVTDKVMGRSVGHYIISWE